MIVGLQAVFVSENDPCIRRQCILRVLGDEISTPRWSPSLSTLRSRTFAVASQRLSAGLVNSGVNTDHFRRDDRRRKIKHV